MGIVVPDTGGGNTLARRRARLRFSRVDARRGSRQGARPARTASRTTRSSSPAMICSCGSANVGAAKLGAGNNATVSARCGRSPLVSNETGAYFPTNSGGCVTAYWGNATYVSWAALPPTAGACTSTPNATNPEATAEHVCVPMGCTSSACAALPGGFRDVLYQAGVQIQHGLHAHTIGTSVHELQRLQLQRHRDELQWSDQRLQQRLGLRWDALHELPDERDVLRTKWADPAVVHVQGRHARGGERQRVASSATLVLPGTGTVCCPDRAARYRRRRRSARAHRARHRVAGPARRARPRWTSSSATERSSSSRPRRHRVRGLAV